MLSRSFEEKYAKNLAEHLRENSQEYNLYYITSTDSDAKPNSLRANCLVEYEIFLKDNEFIENVERLSSKLKDITTGYKYALENELEDKNDREKTRNILVICFMSKNLSGKRLLIEIYLLGDE